MKNQVAAASLAITKLYDNSNVIDNRQFPAHISLYLGGVSRDSVPELFAAIEKAVTPHLGTRLKANRLYSGYGGFIGIDVAPDSDGRALFQAVMSCQFRNSTIPTESTATLDITLAETYGSSAQPHLTVWNIQDGTIRITHLRRASRPRGC